MTVTEDNAFLRVLKKAHTARAFLALERLGPLSIAEAVDLLGISHVTARRNLNELVHMQIAETEQERGPNKEWHKIYSLRKISVVDNRSARERAGL